MALSQTRPQHIYDPFAPPFWFNGAWIDVEGAASAPERHIARRLKSLGKWARQRPWYFEGLLQPVSSTGAPLTDWQDVVPEIAWLPRTQLGQPILGRHLSRPLGEIVYAGPGDYQAVMTRIEAATTYRIELVIDFEDTVEQSTRTAMVDGAERTFKVQEVVKRDAACRRVTILPPDHGGHIAWIRPLAMTDFVRHLVGVSETEPKAAQRRRPLEVFAREAASVYLDSPRRPALAVAEHFGWRTEGFNWRDDHRGRARVKRVLDAAKALGYLGDSRGRRKSQLSSVEGAAVQVTVAKADRRTRPKS